MLCEPNDYSQKRVQNCHQSSVHRLVLGRRNTLLSRQGLAPEVEQEKTLVAKMASQNVPLLETQQKDTVQTLRYRIAAIMTGSDPVDRGSIPRISSL
jgi:hypothetical protein